MFVPRCRRLFLQRVCLHDGPVSGQEEAKRGREEERRRGREQKRTNAR